MDSSTSMAPQRQEELLSKTTTYSCGKFSPADSSPSCLRPGRALFCFTKASEVICSVRGHFGGDRSVLSIAPKGRPSSLGRWLVGKEAAIPRSGP